MDSYRPLQIGKLTARLPLIQGGMGVGISLGGLAGAVAAEGGIGIISSAQIGFREPDFDKATEEANLRAMRKELAKARELARGGVVGFNIMVALKNYEDYVREAAKAGADIIISGAGLPTDLPKYVEGTDTKIAPIVSTNKSAKVILKYWDKKYSRIPDLLVIEGPKAGGHLGFTREQLEVFTPETYEAEVGSILDTVKEYEEKYRVKIPVALAGTMDTAEKLRHAFSMGVDAVQVATRFVTTEECDADIRYKQAYLNAKEEDIRIVKSPVGMPGRAIENKFLRRVDAGEKIPHTCHQCLHKCNPAEIPYCITDALVNAARGEVEDALLFCGADAYQATRIQTVHEVMNELFNLA